MTGCQIFNKGLYQKVKQIYLNLKMYMEFHITPIYIFTSI